MPRSLLPVLMLLPGLGLASDKPDIQLEWHEPTCEQAHIASSARARLGAACGGSRATQTTVQYQPRNNPLGCQVWAHAWCPEARTPGYQPPGAVSRPTLFADNDFKGTALALEAGEWQLTHVPMRGGGEWKNKAGSVRVPAGWTLRLCSEPGGAGRCSDFSTDLHRLQEAFVGNDAAAYARVAKGPLPPAYSCPRVYEHDGFGGKFLEICNELADLTGSPWNNSISSILVPSGFQVELCGEPHFQGPCHTFEGDARSLGNTLVGGDKASSVRLLRRPR